METRHTHGIEELKEHHLCIACARNERDLVYIHIGRQASQNLVDFDGRRWHTQDFRETGTRRRQASRHTFKFWSLSSSTFLLPLCRKMIVTLGDHWNTYLSINITSQWHCRSGQIEGPVGSFLLASRGAPTLTVVQPPRMLSLTLWCDCQWLVL